jgi:Protein related to penicillin acylase
MNALRLWLSPPQNFALVGLHNTGYITAGLYPTFNETLPDGAHVNVVGSRSLLNGTLPEFMPDGAVPFRFLPQVENPSRGYAFAPNQPTVGKNYPYPFVGGFWTSGGRAETIYHYLQDHPGMTTTDMMSLQGNVSDYWASLFTPIIVAALSGMHMNSSELNAYHLLENWNYTAYENSTGMTVYWYELSEIYNLSFDRVYAQQGLGSMTKPFDTSAIYLALNDPNSTYWFNGSFTNIVRAAFSREVSLLLGKLGPVNTWTWGRVHLLEIASLTGLQSLGLGPYPIWGDSHTVSAAYVSRQLSVPEPFVTVGPSLREVSDPAMASYYGVFPGGPSENPLSYYFSNQVMAWMDHDYYNFSQQVKEVRITYE